MRALALVLDRLVTDESGATAIEYGLICSLIVVVIIAAMSDISAATIEMYAQIVGAMG